MITLAAVAPILRESHYLGPAKRGVAYSDHAGVMVFANPSSRRLPQKTWMELTRWCILDPAANSGSSQCARAVRWVRDNHPEVTTVVSYSDPSVGHDGALYRASNWLWAPTWHRLRPPPSGNGTWDGDKTQATKDRWVYPLRKDGARAAILAIKDDGIRRKMPWAEYAEPHWSKYGRSGGGGDFRRWHDVRMAA